MGTNGSKSRRMTVAITGTLSRPREELAKLISATRNARFVSTLARDTDYLVGARFDTTKAHNAARFGVTIIPESELLSYLAAGEFPQRQHRNTHVMNWPEITWRETVDNPVAHFLRYSGADGEATERFVVITRYGTSQIGIEYFEGFDGIRMKTFRKDRVISLMEV